MKNQDEKNSTEQFWSQHTHIALLANERRSQSYMSWLRYNIGLSLLAPSCCSRAAVLSSVAHSSILHKPLLSRTPGALWRSSLIRHSSSHFLYHRHPLQLLPTKHYSSASSAVPRTFLADGLPDSHFEQLIPHNAIFDYRTRLATMLGRLDYQRSSLSADQLAQLKALITAKEFEELFTVLSARENEVVRGMNPADLLECIYIISVKEKCPLIGKKLFEKYKHLFEYSPTPDLEISVLETQITIQYALKNYRAVIALLFPKYSQLVNKAEQPVYHRKTVLKLVLALSHVKHFTTVKKLLTYLIVKCQLQPYTTFLQQLIGTMHLHSDLSIVEDIFKLFKDHNLKIQSSAYISMLQLYQSRAGCEHKYERFLEEHKEMVADYDIKMLQTCSLVSNLRKQEDVLLAVSNDKNTLRSYLKTQAIDIYKMVQQVIIAVNANQELSTTKKKSLQQAYLKELLRIFSTKKYYPDMLRILKIINSQNLGQPAEAINMHHNIGIYFRQTEQFESFLTYLQNLVINSDNGYLSITEAEVSLLIDCFYKSYPLLTKDLRQILQTIDNNQNQDVRLPNWESKLPKKRPLSSIELEVEIEESLRAGRRPSFEILVQCYKSLIVENKPFAEKVLKLLKENNYKIGPQIKLAELKQRIFAYLKQLSTTSSGIDVEYTRLLLKNKSINFKAMVIKYKDDSDFNKVQQTVHEYIEHFIADTHGGMSLGSYIELGQLASSLDLFDVSNNLLSKCDQLIMENSNHDGNEEDKDINVIINSRAVMLTYQTLLHNYKMQRSYEKFEDLILQILQNAEFKMLSGISFEAETQFSHLCKLTFKNWQAQFGVHNVDHKSELADLKRVLSELPEITEIDKQRFFEEFRGFKEYYARVKNHLFQLRLRYDQEYEFVKQDLGKMKTFVEEWTKAHFPSA